MAGFPLTGKDGRISIGGTTLALSSWSVKSDANGIEFTNFTSVADRNGEPTLFYEGTTGKKTLEFTVKGMWDADENPMDDPPNLDAGSLLDTVVLYVSVTNDIGWTIPEAIVLSTPVTNEVNGKVEFEASCKATGQFYRPGETP